MISDRNEIKTIYQKEINRIQEGNKNEGHL